MKKTPDPHQFAKTASDPRAAMRFLAEFAACAPSSHNTQPWLFRMKGDVIEVRGNASRALPLSDPLSREFFISIGCAVENIMIAADYCGLAPAIEYFPEPSNKMLAAKIRIARGSAKADENHLIFQIGKRHANREPFEAKEIPEAALRELSALREDGCTAQFVTDPSAKEKAGKIVGEATTFAFNDKGFTKELSEWMKPSFPKYPDGMPGYNLGIPFPISFIVPLAIRYANVTASQRKMVDDMLDASAAFLVISSEDGPRQWVACGRLLERIWLTASRLGINMGILAAAIEMNGYAGELKQAIGAVSGNARPQAFARLGYSPKTPKPSPRLSVDDLIIE